MKIRELRKTFGITQKDLAEILETSPQVVSRYERGEHQPDFDTLIKIAKYFNVSVDYLIGATPKEFGNVSASAGDNLDEEEKELIECFRKLNIFGREAIMIQVKALAEKHNVIVK